MPASVEADDSSSNRAAVDSASATVGTTKAAGLAGRSRDGGRRQLLAPLWVAAISLAVIAVALVIGFITVEHALHSAQTSVQQLQQQVSQLQTGLKALSGGFS